MPEKTVYINDVGDVLLRHSNKARHLNISIRPFAGVKVSIPVGMSYASATRFVNQKKKWIIQHLRKIKEYEIQLTVFDESTVYNTAYHKLCLKSSDRENISVRLSNKKINVTYPISLNSNSKDVQSAIRLGIDRALKVEAKEFLPERVNKLAEQFGFKYDRLAIKNIKSRWGSCSRNKNINLSVHLMRLPDHLIDYVILHELAHTVHLNHSNRFWDLLDEVTGGAKILDKELKKYRIAIY